MPFFKAKTELTLRGRALRMLARREYSRHELERKLMPFCADGSEVQALLAEFVHREWLSEARFVEQTLSRRRRRYGAQRIVHELREKGVAAEAIASARNQLTDTELEAATTVWRTKFGKPPLNHTERARQLRFMQSRGFALETVLRIIKEVSKK